MVVPLLIASLLGCPPATQDSAQPQDSTPPEDTGPGDETLGEVKYAGREVGLDAGRFLDAGDVDGDGQRDLLISAMRANQNLGGAFLVPGPHDASAPMDEAGWFLAGDPAAGGAGRSVALGDSDGDGYDDVLLGAPYDGSSSAWLLLGPIDGELTISQVGLRLSGTDGTLCGHGSDLADVSGDGLADLVVSAYTSDGQDGFGPGAIYVEHGPVEAGLHLPDEADAVLVGEDEDTLTGKIVTAAGDLDGDGLIDLLIPAVAVSAGVHDSSVHVAMAPFEGHISLADAVHLIADQPDDKAGVSLASGDLDGDGLDDVVVGSFGTGTVPGAAYVVLAPPVTDTLLSDADAIVLNDDPSDEAGCQVGVGDADGEGPEDLLVGTPSADDRAGAVQLYHGPLSGSYAIGDADARWRGEAADDTLGEGLFVDDLDGDGAMDLILGAPLEASEAEAGGAVYLIFGEP